jgi:hypothetical protein
MTEQTHPGGLPASDATRLPASGSSRSRNEATRCGNHAGLLASFRKPAEATPLPTGPPAAGIAAVAQRPGEGWGGGFARRAPRDWPALRNEANKPAWLCESRNAAREVSPMITQVADAVLRGRSGAGVAAHVHSGTNPRGGATTPFPGSEPRTVAIRHIPLNLADSPALCENRARRYRSLLSRFPAE